ncbi:hypothetical protein K432DRAFT_327579 [Lepidopterella palustris CBS 459.81]|uniref:Zinc/iron permease n=1 Tax=Lepidopterella palustris CBS 459.81 TaxID=1314670 RepID=A0A8E2EBJ0_9PEZI|nr:hypothetical protein K432DRAFT_327579 [Lepidopterella palustris CBS 459.81]
MVLDNDARGWVMTAISGIACTAGASIICIDILIRQFPGHNNFKIQDSNPFLSSSLSLSFGVMIFSSLYSMLPNAKISLQNGGFTSKAAAWTLIGCFLTGVVGIQLVSRVLHHYIPHSVVDCDHSHDEEEGGEIPEQEFNKNVLPGDDSAGRRTSYPWKGTRSYSANPETIQESLPDRRFQIIYGTTPEEDGISPVARRPSFQTQISSSVSRLVSGSKQFCDENGQCFGYSDPCGQECFKIVQSRGISRVPPTLARPAGIRSTTTPNERQPLLQDVDENNPLSPIQSNPADIDHPSHFTSTFPSNGTFQPPLRKALSNGTISTQSTTSRAHDHPHRSHHHHVPTNAFLSIGLQTSIAIALHKLPEGFITYATNHANPTLGISVFLALFIHNITEGFAMALPLYLAINSRWKAMFWSSLLGGASQPLGAGVAALWFKIAGRHSGAEPGEGVYGAMFAITAGIMASVGLQLFGESLDLTHSRGLCLIFAFVGMGILGVSSALTA